MASDPSILRRALADLPDPLGVPVLGGAFDVTARPPGSKSETNRAVILAALAHGKSVLRGALTGADDAEVALAAIRALGAKVDAAGDTLTIEGVGGRWPVGHAGVTLDLHNSGTSTRFLAAAAMLATGPVTITGNERMCQRPIGELTDALHTLGAHIEWHKQEGYPPLTIIPPAGGLPRDVELAFDSPASSQFVSALMMLGPWVTGGITVRITGNVTSSPYLTMTLDLLDRAGATVRSTDDLRLMRVSPGERHGLEAFELDIEPDASGATYLWTAAAIVPGARAMVEGLGAGALQGDARYAGLLERMGAVVEPGSPDRPGTLIVGPVVLRPILADLAPMPDTAMSLAVAACFAPGTSVIRGLKTLRIKETDRIEALRVELGKIGVSVEVGVQGDDETITITPPAGGVDRSASAGRVEFDTYDDHRMAMSLSLIGLVRPNVYIRDPGCVAKTYPTYWKQLAELYAPAVTD
ncbi:MAG: 3-phosphoshikimate 1-carboxyvinyltransferase [Phycisphaerales bacterium]|nr:3-phosphoshikimate 1-carboxyvinyltransferase [Phycisphaerales bacterium]